jgi:hypothetical protein
MATAAWSLGDWSIPGPARRSALLLTVAIVVPTLAAYLVVGFATALAVFIGFVANLTPATRLPWRLGLAAVLTTALTGAVATALLGQPVPAACFAALACLVAAPGNIWHNNLLGAIPTVAAVYTTLLIDAEPVETLAGLLVGGAAAVGLMARRPGSGELAGVPERVAWRHAAAMALTVGVVVYVMSALAEPWGYVLPMTLTLVLRPFGGETLPMARQRVLGTLVGAVLAAALVATLPLQFQLLLQACLLFLLLAYSTLGRYTLYVIFVTPFVIFLGGRAEAYTAEVGLQRVVATLAAAVLAGLIALWLARADRADTAETPARGTITA